MIAMMSLQDVGPIIEANGFVTVSESACGAGGMVVNVIVLPSFLGPINPISLALAAGATFVVRGFSGEQKHLTDLIRQAIRHKGFAFIDVFSPFVTYNHDNTYPWFKQRVNKKLEDDPSYHPTRIRRAEV